MRKLVRFTSLFLFGFLLLFFLSLEKTNAADDCECASDQDCVSKACFQAMCGKDEKNNKCFCSTLSKQCVEKVPFSLLPVERTDWKEMTRGQIQDSDIRTTDLGNVELYDLPRYIKHISNFLIFLASSIAVFMIVYGGYRYIIGGVAGDKEEGKKIIMRAIFGLIIVIFAYAIVEVVSIAFTSSPELCGNGEKEEGEACDKMKMEEQCGENQVCNNSCECVDIST